MFEVLDTTELKSWDLIVQTGAELKLSRLQDYFFMGDLANHACPNRRRGRPKKEDDATAYGTVTALAKAIGENRARVSNAGNDAKFWSAGYRRELPLEATETQIARARKESGWKPSGDAPSRPQRDTALAAVVEWIEGEPPKRAETPVLNYVAGAYKKLKKALVRKDELAFVDRELVQDAFDMLSEVVQDEIDEED